MNKQQVPNPDLDQLKEMQNEVSELKKKLDDANVLNRAMWKLLVEISRRMQVSSAAIKAAVSSLLGYDIFWDGSTQHELLEIIDDSTDQVSDQITLISLAFRSESRSLEIKPEPNEIQEILSYVLDTIAGDYSDLEFDIEILPDGSPILVDYEYLSVSLKLLFEVLTESQKPQKMYRVVTQEEGNFWFIDVLGVKEEIAEYISTVTLCSADELTQGAHISPTNKLKLLVMCRIFGLQEIHIKAIESLENEPGIRVLIPIVEKIEK
ncbi:MAG: hypothetical protein ACK2U1_14835 [Anaerolineales bacterium]|jgi:hypothetical protein